MRVHRAVLAASILVLAAACGPAQETAEQGEAGAAQTVSDPQNLSGMWWGGPEAQPMTIAAGARPQLTPAGEERYKETGPETLDIAAKASDPFDLRKCVGVGSPRIWSQPYPFEIVQTPTDVAIVYEHNHNFRIVYMNEEQITDDTRDIDEGYWGNSVGHWDGDTLVIESYRIKERTVLDDSGLPHTSNLRLVERFRKLDDNTLEVVVTVNDPDFYVQPWSARWTFQRHPELRMEEYVCGYGLHKTRYTQDTPQQ